MRDQVDTAGRLEAWVVSAPEAVDTVGLSRDGLEHPVLVPGHVIRYIESDVAEEAPNSWERLGRDVFEGEFVLRRVTVGRGDVLFVFEGEIRAPVDGQNHYTAQIRAHMGLDCFATELDVDLAPERIDGMGEVEAFHSLRQLLANTMNHQYKITNLRPSLFAFTGRTGLVTIIGSCCS